MSPVAELVDGYRQLVGALDMVLLHAKSEGALCACTRVSPCPVFQQAKEFAAERRTQVADLDAQWSALNAPTVVLPVAEAAPGDEHIDDDLLRRAMAARNPAHGKEIPPFTMTPAEMRAAAERRTIDAKALRRKVRRQPSYWFWKGPVNAIHRLRHAWRS